VVVLHNPPFVQLVVPREEKIRVLLAQIQQSWLLLNTLVVQIVLPNSERFMQIGVHWVCLQICSHCSYVWWRLVCLLYAGISRVCFLRLALASWSVTLYGFVETIRVSDTWVAIELLMFSCLTMISLLLCFSWLITMLLWTISIIRSSRLWTVIDYSLITSMDGDRIKHRSASSTAPNRSNNIRK
jgi:hypothetical protein